MNNKTNYIPMNQNKLIFIECLRFFSAFSVLVWHYVHFSFQSYAPLDYDKNNLPFNEILRPLYDLGGAGVLFFWCISGYIFFYKYQNSIIENRTGPKTFFINRFSRLYPLHFLTLIAVFCMQIFYFNQNNTYFVYEFNDLYHLFLQFFFISHWGFENGYSYNGPIWSVSVEIIVYIIFFITLKFFGKSSFYNILIILTCVLSKVFTDTTYILFDCVIFFYCGCQTLIITNFFQKKKILHYFHSKFYIFILILIPFTCWFFELNKIKYFYFLFFLIYGCCLLMISSMKFNLDSKVLNLIKALGNMTYGSYLLHFPLQIAIVIIFNFLEIKLPIYENWFFLFYIFLVLFLAHISYNKFELPIQKFIRKYQNN